MFVYNFDKEINFCGNFFLRELFFADNEKKLQKSEKLEPVKFSATRYELFDTRYSVWHVLNSNERFRFGRLFVK